MEQFINYNRLVHFCDTISNKVEQEIQSFDEHRTFDEEKERVFRLGILYAVTKIGYAIRNENADSFGINPNYEEFNKKYEMYQGLKEAKAKAKAHQISMEEYLEEKNKEKYIDTLAEKVASILMKDFDAKYKSTKKDK